MKLPQRGDTVFAAVIHNNKLAIGTGVVKRVAADHFFAQVALDGGTPGSHPVVKNFYGKPDGEGVWWGVDGRDERKDVLELAQVEVNAGLAQRGLLRDT